MKKNIRLICIFSPLLSSILFADSIQSSLPFCETGSCLEIANIEAYKEVDELLLLIQKRLAVMHEVARWKWNEGASIEDIKRDQMLTDKLLQIADERKIPPDFAKKFIQAQIDASVIIQKEDFETWVAERQQMFETVCDLESELRPYITQLSRGIFEKLGSVYPFIRNCSHAKGFIQAPLSRRPEDQVSTKSWEKALSPFLEAK